MARKSKSTVTQEELDALESAIQTLGTSEPDESNTGSGAGTDTKEYLGEEGLKRLVELVADALKAKQDTLKQGDNITIEGGVISAADTGATSVEASGEKPLTLGAEYDKDTRKMTVTGSVDLSGYAKEKELENYLPLAGGTVTGNLKVEKTLNATTIITTQEIDIDSEIGRFDNKGETTLSLTENADAPNVVVADDYGKLYKTPKSEIGGSGGGDYLPLSGGTLTGKLTLMDADLEVNGKLTVIFGAGIQGAVYLYDNVYFHYTTVFEDTADVTFKSTATFNGTTAFNGTSAFNGQAAFNAQTDFCGGTYIDTDGHIHLPSGVEIY